MARLENVRACGKFTLGIKSVAVVAANNIYGLVSFVERVSRKLQHHH